MVENTVQEEKETAKESLGQTEAKLHDAVEKVKEGIGKGFETVSSRSRDLLEIAKVRRQIGKLQSEKDDAIEELGDLVYLMFTHETMNEEEIEAKCKPIEALDKDIKTLETKLKKLQSGSVTICDCGTSVPKAANFCLNCGKKMTDSESE